MRIFNPSNLSGGKKKVVRSLKKEVRNNFCVGNLFLSFHIPLISLKVEVLVTPDFCLSGDEAQELFTEIRGLWHPGKPTKNNGEPPHLKSQRSI